MLGEKGKNPSSIVFVHLARRARIYKRLGSQVIDFQESIPPAYVAGAGRYVK